MRILTSLILLPLVACRYEESIPERDLVGKVVIPRAAATQQVINADGTLGEEITDVRLLGPVYLGAYSGVDTESFPYPHPAMGPVITSDYPGNTFPYGGTTVGRFEFGCFESTACRVTTGRFKDYADVLDYFANVLGDPVTDARGDVVDSPSAMQQACYTYHNVTTDAEIAFVGGDNLKFTENADGDFEAEFLMPHTVFVENMVIWGWMDAPRITLDAGDVNGQFSTCDGATGRQVNEYDQEYFQGRTQYDLLNFPSLYVYEGDYVADGQATVASVDDVVTVNLNIPVTEAE
jgi:hypothetical protein